MPAYHITSADSLFTNAGEAFFASASSASSLLIDSDAFLLTTESHSVAADLNGPFAWTVTVNGQIISDVQQGVYLRAGISGTSIFTVSSGGSIASDDAEAIYAASSISITNAGTMFGNYSSTLYFDGGTSHKVVNSGAIEQTNTQAIYDHNGAGSKVDIDTISNTGLIGGDIFLAGATQATLGNSGTISGTVTLTSGNDVVVNNGTISGDVTLGAGNNSFTESALGSVVDVSANAGNNMGYGISGNNTVTIAGSAGQISLGSGLSLITIAATGRVNGNVYAGGANNNGDVAVVSNAGMINGDIGFNRGTHTFSNSGHVIGNYSSSFVSSTDHFSNSGTFTGDVSAGNTGAINTIGNSGTLIGDFTGGNEGNVFTNSGSVLGAIEMHYGNNHFINSGHVTGTYHVGGGGDQSDVSVLTNSGTWTGNLQADSYMATVINTGHITGNWNDGTTFTHFNNIGIFTGEIEFGFGTDTLTNSGTVYGDVAFDSNEGSGGAPPGAHSPATVSNSGLINGSVTAANGNNHFTNSGTFASYLYTGLGNDVVINTGKIVGLIDLGGGDSTTGDSFSGGNYSDNVQGGHAGNNIYKLGGGNDIFHGGDGSSETVDGGAGIDTYIADITTHLFGGGGTGGRVTSNDLSIDIDTVDHNLEPFGIGGLKNTAVTAAGTETISNFENVTGGSGNNSIYGNASANVLDGSLSSHTDDLYGYGGNDVLIGGSGNDVLAGGAGADRLTGGAGQDSFLFKSVTDSGPLKAQRDVITDFTHGTDKIDLTYLESAAHETFHYINGDSSQTPSISFSGHVGALQPGELRSYWTGDGETIELDINGDGKADFAIDLTHIGHHITLTASDFVL